MVHRVRVRVGLRLIIGYMLALVFVASTLAIIGADRAEAVDCSGLSGRRHLMCINARNDGERFAVQYICKGGGTRCGAMWMSSPGTSYTNDVINTASWNATSLSLDLRGSVNGNGQSQARVWATNVTVSQNGRILVSGGTLDRGTHPSGAYHWVDGGSSIRVNGIDISGVIAPGSSGRIILQVRRCFYSSPGGSGVCATQDVEVWIKREQAPNQWTVEGQSRVSINGGSLVQNATAAPGQRVRFFHYLRNNSSYTIPPYTLKRIGINQDVNGTTTHHAWASPYTRSASPWNTFYEPSDVKPYNNVFGAEGIVTQDDVGKTVCQKILWLPGAWNTDGWWLSSNACASVPYDYELRPEVQAPDYINEGTIEVSGVTARINHTGSTRSNRANYAVVRFVLRGGGNYTVPGGEGAVVPYDRRSPGNLVGDWDCYIAKNTIKNSRPGLQVADCTSNNLARNGAGTIIQRGGLEIPLGKDNLSGVTMTTGDQLCYMTIVSTYNQHVNTSTFRYAVDCARVAGRPKVQFWGADVRVGVGIDGSAGNNNAEVRTSLTRVRR